MKRKIIVIGTMHNMFPKAKGELDRILEKINPDQVFVEIDSKDLNSKALNSYPKEMIFAYKWALKNKKVIGAFDIDMELNKKESTQEKENKIEKDWMNKYAKKDWRYFNKDTSKIRESIWTIEKILDKKKILTRQKIMLKNIKNLALKEGTILVLTGAFHLDFFSKNLKGAIFPYR
jgi:hypothetical protein